jgi:hypothetical protein
MHVWLASYIWHTITLAIEYMWWMMFLLPGYLVFEYLETQDIAKKSQEDRINFEKSLNFFPVAKINKDVYKEQQF